MADKLRQEASAAYVDDDFAAAIDLYTQVARAAVLENVSMSLDPGL